MAKIIEFDVPEEVARNFRGPEDLFKYIHEQIHSQPSQSEKPEEEEPEEVKYKYADHTEKLLENGLELKFAIPGCGKDDVEISFENEKDLLISYKNFFSEAADPETVFYKASLKRGFDLGKITANLSNGLLTLFIPKEAKKTKTIKININ